MAAMLAHEVKNPLSGIRGAAQLLKGEVSPEHQPLAELIYRETDRIRDLLAQVEIFDRVRCCKSRQSISMKCCNMSYPSLKPAFAPHVAFHERYDPSLPEVSAHRDMLVQLFLNLVKNAAEALAGKPDAAITLTTAYRSGPRLHVDYGGNKVPLPVAVLIEDNGPHCGISPRSSL